jgi:hypothetical protein
MMILTFGQGMTQPNGIAGAISVHPHIAGAASGLLGFIQMVVSAVATLVLAAIQAPVAWPTVGVLTACALLSTLAFACAIVPGRSRPAATPAVPDPPRPASKARPKAEPMPEPTTIWSGLTPDEHELQYNPQRAVPHFKDYQAQREPANTRARETLECRRDIPYTGAPARWRLSVPGGSGTVPSSSMAATGGRRTRRTSHSWPSIWWRTASPPSSSTTRCARSPWTGW